MILRETQSFQTAFWKENQAYSLVENNPAFLQWEFIKPAERHN